MTRDDMSNKKTAPLNSDAFRKTLDALRKGSGRRRLTEPDLLLPPGRNDGEQIDFYDDTGQVIILSVQWDAEQRKWLKR
jgi:hypothetical protein